MKCPLQPATHPGPSPPHVVVIVNPLYDVTPCDPDTSITMGSMLPHFPNQGLGELWIDPRPNRGSILFFVSSCSLGP
jgi:hypothetical protein